MEQSARPCQQTCRRAVVRQARNIWVKMEDQNFGVPNFDPYPSHVGMFSVSMMFAHPKRIDSVGFPCRNPNIMIFWKKIWFFSSNSTSCLPIFPFPKWRPQRCCGTPVCWREAGNLLRVGPQGSPWIGEPWEKHEKPRIFFGVPICRHTKVTKDHWKHRSLEAQFW